jgi:hypothetical protein
MKRIDSSNADWLVYEEPWSVGVFIAVVIYGLLAAGVVALWWYDYTPCALFLVGGIIFLFIRGWLTTSRELVYEVRGRQLPLKKPVRVELDRLEQTVTVKHSMWMGREEVYRRDEFTFLQISLQRTRHGRSTELEYLLHLIGPTAAVLAGWKDDYHALRTTAGEMGTFLHMDVVDASQGEPVVLRGEDVARGIREQAAEPAAQPTAGGEGLAMLPPSANPPYEHEWHGQEFVFRLIPPAQSDWGNRSFYVGVLALLLVLGGAAGAWVYTHRNPNDVGAEYCCPSVSLILALGWTWIFWSFESGQVTRTTLTANRESLTRVEEHRRSATTTQTFPVETIREIRLSQNGHLRVFTDRSDASLITLDPADAEWLRACLLRALRS